MRITGGELRSRTLRAPRGQSTRPTSDRVREALFGVLTSAGAVEQARVLDLYAGTGALAIEALSRGASGATLVESSREALEVIRANLRALSLDARARVFAGDVNDALRRLRGPYDLVLADPPWAIVGEEASRVLSRLAQSGALSERAVLVLEHATRTAPPRVEGLATGETRRYGDTSVTFYAPACAPGG